MSARTKPAVRQPAGEDVEAVFDLDEARALAAKAQEVALQSGRCVIFVSEERGERRLLRRWPDGRVEEWGGHGWQPA